MIRMSVIFFSRHAFCNTFSTHDLSWRSTLQQHCLAVFYGFFNSRPLVEIDIQKPEAAVYQIFFNSRPLVEIDMYCLRLLLLNIFFNSRPLVEIDKG